MNSNEILNKGIQAGYNVELAREFGIAVAVVLNRLVYLHKSTPREDKFTWQTAKDWEEHTGLSDYQVKKALDMLSKLKIIELKNTYIIGTQIKCRHQRFILDQKNAQNLKSDFQETSESETQETSESEMAVSLKPVNSIEHSIEHSITVTKVTEQAPEKYGNPQINELFEEWEKHCGFRIDSKVKQNRYACQRLIKSRGFERVKNVIPYVAVSQADQYAPGINNFMDLAEKWNNLAVWYKKKKMTNSKKYGKIVIPTNERSI